MIRTQSHLLRPRSLAVRAFVCTLLSAGVAAGLNGLVIAQTPPTPPMAKKDPKTTTLHGVTLTDDYAWLRNKGTPEVTAYLEAENAYTEAGTAHTAALRETLYKEMLGRIKESDERYPCGTAATGITRAPSRGSRIRSSAARRERSTRRRRCISIRTRWPQGKKFHALGGMDVSPDGAKLIYLEDLTAFREYTLHVQGSGDRPDPRVDPGRLERHGVGRRQPDVLLHARGRGQARRHRSGVTCSGRRASRT